MKKVLMIAHQFPPMAGPGVQRTSKFVKYLRNFEWEPIVFTRSIDKMPLTDESLLSDIPSDINIIYTKPHDYTEWPKILGLFGKFIARKVLIPDGERIWQKRSCKKAQEALTKHKIDLIYSTSYPYSDHLLALYLKKLNPDIPWVADFRDEWSNNPYFIEMHRNRFRVNKEKNMEKEVIKTADTVITNTPVMMKNFINIYPEYKSKFCSIPNGFDKEDFNNLTAIKPNNEKFTLTYTGALYGRRKPNTFFESLMNLINEGSVDSKKIKVNLIGNYKVDYIQGLIEKYGLKNIVEIFPYMKHNESIKNLLNSDALLLIEGAGLGSEAFYTGKLFEYMNAGRPILAVIPKNGAAASLIKETKTGTVSDYSDISAIMNNIKNLYSNWLEKKNIYLPDQNEISKYERKELTSKLAEIFNNLINYKNNN